MRVLKVVASIFLAFMDVDGAAHVSVEAFAEMANSGEIGEGCDATTFLYDSPVQRMPSWDQTGIIHFTSTTSGSACWLASLAGFAALGPLVRRFLWVK